MGSRQACTHRIDPALVVQYSRRTKVYWPWSLSPGWVRYPAAAAACTGCDRLTYEVLKGGPADSNLRPRFRYPLRGPRPWGGRLMARQTRALTAYYSPFFSFAVW